MWETEHGAAFLSEHTRGQRLRGKRKAPRLRIQQASVIGRSTCVEYV